MWKQVASKMQVLTVSSREVPLSISVIVPVRNEARNLPRCLESLRGVGEVYVIDSHSTDNTAAIVHSCGAKLVQFDYAGGWPKKRQWAMDTLPLAHPWILLLDADETLTPELAQEIRRAIENPKIDGYHIALRMYFLGKILHHGDAGFYKLSLFRRGKGRFECRFRNQDASMCDMEVHEHIVVDGPTAKLENPLVHHNLDSLSRYIQKHDNYSNWEAGVWAQGDVHHEELVPRFWGTQAQRRRWLKSKLLNLPGSPVLYFLYKYLFRLGFLDGRPGMIYAGFQATQLFQIKAKLFERLQKNGSLPVVMLAENTSADDQIGFETSSQAVR
jgi:glycosyltransferase involved in cell wall biosynthesis